MDNDRTQQIIADHNLVMAMVSNLRCCPTKYAHNTLEGLAYRWNERAGDVPRPVLDQILSRLPIVSDGSVLEEGLYIYRAGDEVIKDCHHALLHSQSRAIQSARYEEAYHD